MRSAGLEKAGGATTDHGGVARYAAGVNIFRFQPSLKGDQISFPVRSLLVTYLVYPAQELLRGVVMGVGQTGHRDQATGIDGLFRPVEPGGIIRRADPLNGVALDGDGSVGDN